MESGDPSCPPARLGRPQHPRARWQRRTPCHIATSFDARRCPPTWHLGRCVLLDTQRPRCQVGGHLRASRSEEHTSELQSRPHLVCRLLLEKKKKENNC